MTTNTTNTTDINTTTPKMKPTTTIGITLSLAQLDLIRNLLDEAKQRKVVQIEWLEQHPEEEERLDQMFEAIKERALAESILRIIGTNEALT